MNQKAEAFKAYTDKNDPKAFNAQELEKDEFHTVLFRSHMKIDDQSLPFVVTVDDSPYVTIRILLVQNGINDENRAAVMELLNEYNRTYKAFKHYIDVVDEVVLDCCLVVKNDQMDGNLIYLMLQSMANHLQKDLKEITSKTAKMQ
jgi:hypothetical protein